MNRLERQQNPSGELFEGRRRKEDGEGEQQEEQEEGEKEETVEDEGEGVEMGVAVGGSTDEDAEEGEKLVGRANESGEFLISSFGALVVWSPRN